MQGAISMQQMAYQRFQNELINKLQFKTSSKVSSDALLFKTFKFFDLYNNGYLNSADFFRAIAKCGVIVQTDQMKSIFEHYSNDAKIYYKQFIDQLLFKETSENKSIISEQNEGSHKQSRINNNFTNQQASRVMKESPMSKLKAPTVKNYQTPEEILEFIRQQIRKDGVTGMLQFANKLKASDTQKTHKINSHRLKAIMTFLNLQQVKTLIQNFQPSPSGEINYAELIYTLKGDINEQRLSLIHKTFCMLDQKMLEKQKSVRQFNYINHVIKINFNIFQAIDDGYLTDEDFTDLFQFISFAFISNQSFVEYIMKAYYDTQEARSTYSSKSSRREFDRESNRPGKHQNKEEEIVKDFKKDKVQQEDNKQDIKSVSRHSRMSKRTQSSHVKEVELIILRIKRRLASKGTKGFLSFQRAMKNADSDSDGFINLDQFKKVIKEQRIDITNTQSNIIFDIFDDKHTGLIDFGSFFYTIKGQIPEERKLLIDRIWNRVSKNGSNTTFSIVRQMINLRGHPDIQNGRRYQEDIKKQIDDTILLIQDLNGGSRSEEITKDDFIEYLQNLSMTIPEDQLFEMIAKNFWKIPSQNRIQDEYAGSRKMFDTTKKSYLMDHHRYAVNGGSSTQNAPYGTFSEPTNYQTEHRKL